MSPVSAGPSPLVLPAEEAEPRWPQLLSVSADSAERPEPPPGPAPPAPAAAPQGCSVDPSRDLLPLAGHAAAPQNPFLKTLLNTAAVPLSRSGPPGAAGPVV